MGKSQLVLKKITEKKILEVPYFTVWEDQVERPSGTIKPYYRIERETFAIIIPLDKKGNFCMVKQFRYPVGDLSVEFPIGYVFGQTPQEMAETELVQETGIRAGKIEKIGSIWPLSGLMNEEGVIFLATDLTFGKAEPEEDEFLETLTMSESEIEQAIKDGIIRDAISIAAFQIFRIQKKE